MEKQIRINWKNKLTGETGEGEWQPLSELDNMNAWLKLAEAELPETHFWMDRNYSDSTTIAEDTWVNFGGDKPMVWSYGITGSPIRDRQKAELDELNHRRQQEAEARRKEYQNTAHLKQIIACKKSYMCFEIYKN
jgi:hypothetical protein